MSFRQALQQALAGKGKTKLADLRLLLSKRAEEWEEDEEGEEEGEEDEEEDEEAEEGSASTEPLKVNTQALCRMINSLSRTNGRIEREIRQGAEKAASQSEARELAEQRERAKVQIRRIAARVGLRVEIFDDGGEPAAPAAARSPGSTAGASRPATPDWARLRARSSARRSARPARPAAGTRRTDRSCCRRRRPPSRRRPAR